jgi:hypothetical protein
MDRGSDALKSHVEGIDMMDIRQVSRRLLKRKNERSELYNMMRMEASLE